MNTSPILTAHGVSRSYRGAETGVDVLKDVSLEVAEGQVVCIIGASGAGKSTLLHILGSLDRPDTGTVAIRGQDVHALSGRNLDRLRSHTLGFVFQFHFLLPDFTALENVMMPA
ncbi:MAG TPA: ATP-binding cassette domain-containing protein, partial [Candidatus Krumholzibacteria bacterium]|nr:ATP-binding cassette domain-containing protein [Candidatus Krumholzibacteria bacterium]